MNKGQEITWTPEKLGKLKKAHREAVAAEKESFIFQDEGRDLEFLTKYAGYLITYLKAAFFGAAYARKPAKRELIHTVEAADVGKTAIHGVPGHPTCFSPLGRVQACDVGKRIYRVCGIYQVESREQFERRTKGA